MRRPKPIPVTSPSPGGPDPPARRLPEPPKARADRTRAPAPTEANSCHRIGTGCPRARPEVLEYQSDPRRRPLCADRSQFLSQDRRPPSTIARFDDFPSDPTSPRRANPSLRLSSAEVRPRAEWEVARAGVAGLGPMPDRLVKEHPNIIAVRGPRVLRFRAGWPVAGARASLGPRRADSHSYGIRPRSNALAPAARSGSWPGRGRRDSGSIGPCAGPARAAR